MNGFAKAKRRRPGADSDEEPRRAIRIKGRSGSASATCPTCGEPLRTGRIWFGSRESRIERCDQCRQLRLVGSRVWVRGGEGWDRRLQQDAVDSGRWEAMTGGEEFDSRYTVRTVPYLGDARGGDIPASTRGTRPNSTAGQQARPCTASGSPLGSYSRCGPPARNGRRAGSTSWKPFASGTSSTVRRS